jgi:transposase
VAQRLRDEHGVAASESSVRRWISANLSEEAVREKVTVARGPVPPGSEAQIDYGRLGMWFDPVSGRRVAVWAFVMVLAHSRYLFVQPVLKMGQSSWCASHVAAFEFFGGVPARLVPDRVMWPIAVNLQWRFAGGSDRAHIGQSDSSQLRSV